MTVNDKRLQNLIPFKPGQSGNPGGRRLNDASSIAKALRDMMAAPCPVAFVEKVFGKRFAAKIAEQNLTGAQLAAMVLAMLGLKGNLEAIRLMLSYCDGDPKQSLTLDGDVNHTMTVESIREALQLVS